MVRRIGFALLWPLALAFLFVGFNKNDPYLIALRGSGNVAVVVIGIAIAVVLIWRGYWRGTAGKNPRHALVPRAAVITCSASAF
jgi:beta-N-acetylhexosaminidase